VSVTFEPKRPVGYAVSAYDMLIDGAVFADIYRMADRRWYGRTDTGINVTRVASRRLLAQRLMAATPPCQAFLFHGPGHQSSTRCRLTGEHDMHEAEYHGDVARWSGVDEHHGISRCTGFFDEPPRED
jgi:hypothetical protein